MGAFYKVHCTNCGEVLGADKMAIDMDKILRMHLEKVSGRKNNPLLLNAKKVFDEIRIGMYLTKFQMVNDRILEEDGTLHITCQYILNFIEKRYKVNFGELEEVKETKKQKEKKSESSFDMFDDLDVLMPSSEREVNEIPEEILDNLCLKMILYSQVDNDEMAKRNCIKEMLQLLLKHRNEVLLECSCVCQIKKDDKEQEFISGLKVTFLDKETVAYNHMACPYCGESFFIDAGRYEEHIVVMLGSSRVGKTAYLAALVDEINPEYGQPHYKSISIKDTTDKKYTYFRNNILKQYRTGKKIKKTDELKETVALFSLDVVINGKIKILTFVDLPGEVFVPRSEVEKEEGEASGAFIINHRKICCCADAFWFCIDPVQIDQSLHNINERAEKSDKVEQDMPMVLSNIENALNIMGNEKLNVPTAIIITKSDLITPDANLYFKNRDLEKQCLMENGNFRNDLFQSSAANVEQYLKSNNVRNIFHKLNTMFPNKNYFAVAAYGVNVEENTEGSNRAPSGIILPFVWTLSVLGHIKPVKYMRRTERVGFFGRQERVIEYFDLAEQNELFSGER